jgi:hypothetical protein
MAIYVNRGINSVFGSDAGVLRRDTRFLLQSAVSKIAAG